MKSLEPIFKLEVLLKSGLLNWVGSSHSWNYTRVGGRSGASRAIARELSQLELSGFLTHNGYMPVVTIDKINAYLQKLSAEKLAVVYDFVSYLSERELSEALQEATKTEDFALASEQVLKRDWDSPEEDAAWANL